MHGFIITKLRWGRKLLLSLFYRSDVKAQLLRSCRWPLTETGIEPVSPNPKVTQEMEKWEIQSQNHRITVIESNPQRSLSSTLKWMIHRRASLFSKQDTVSQCTLSLAIGRDLDRAFCGVNVLEAQQHSALGAISSVPQVRCFCWAQNFTALVNEMKN